MELNNSDFHSLKLTYTGCVKSRGYALGTWKYIFTFEYPLRLLVLFYLNSLRHSELSNVRIRTYHN
jgi:hypothetical protein